MSRFLTSILLVALLIGPISGQDLAVRSYTERDGLPGSAVLEVRQAADGRLWFATRSGVYISHLGREA